MDLKKIFFPLVSIMVGLGIFVLVMGYVGVRNVFDVFRSTSVLYLSLFFIVTTTIFLINVYRWKIVVNAFGYDISFLNLFTYNSIGYSVGYISPASGTGAAGIPVRAYLLKKHSMPLTEAFSSVTIDKVMELIVNLLFAVFAVLFFIFPLKIFFSLKLVLIAVAIFLLGIVLLSFFTLYFKKGLFSPIFRLFSFLPQIDFIKRLKRETRRLELYIYFFLHYRLKSFVKCLFLSAIVFVLMFLESKFCLLAIGYDASIPYVFLIMAAIALASMAPIPGALGILEIGGASVFFVLGINPYIGVAFALLVRLKDFLWTAFGFVLLSNKGMNFFTLLLKNRRRKKHGARLRS